MEVGSRDTLRDRLLKIRVILTAKSRDGFNIREKLLRLGNCRCIKSTPKLKCKIVAGKGLSQKKCH